MQSLKKIVAPFSRLEWGKCTVTQAKTIKYFAPPVNYDNVVLPEKPKMRFMDRVPQYPAGIKLPKSQKRLFLMRGPELIHNKLQHKQYGIVAESGGRMRWEHFEVTRLAIIRKMDVRRMFCIWRVDPPWQPVTKKSQGQRMGGGKGAIDHYVSPIKTDRIILEMGGKCEYNEVKDMLRVAAERLPFRAIPVSQEIMDQREARKKWEEDNDLNPYSFKYCILNDMMGCRKWLSPYDFTFFGKYK